MKRYIIIFLLALFVITIVASIFDGEKPVNYPSSGEGIVVFGDSLVVGVGASSSKDMVSLLSKREGRYIANFGRSGDTTTSARQRLPEVFEEFPNPEVAIILLGGNDFLQKIPETDTFNNLEFIIREFQNRGAVVLLLGVRGGVLKDNYSSNFSDLSKKMGTAIVPNVLKGIIGDNRYMSDSIHPNDLGYAKIADRVSPVLHGILRD